MDRNLSGYSGHRRHIGLRGIRGQKGSEDRKVSAETECSLDTKGAVRISGHRKLRRFSRHRRLRGNNVQ